MGAGASRAKGQGAGWVGLRDNCAEGGPSYKPDVKEKRRVVH